MTLRRRLDDAFCALVHGHARRDLARVRRQRLTLLVERLARRQAAKERAAVPLSEPGWLVFPSSSTLLNLLKDDLERFMGDAHSVLLHELEFARRDIEARRLWAERSCEVDGDGEQFFLRHVKSGFFSPGELYGKLYAGLGQGPNDYVVDQSLGLWGRYRHRLPFQLQRGIKAFWREVAQ